MPLSLATTSSRPRARWFGCAAAALILAASGCSDDVAVAPPPATDVSQFFWALTFDHHAVTLSTVPPYDTIALTATPRNIDGEPLSGLPAPIFTSADLERVQVSPEGVVRAIAPGSLIPVVATLAQGNVVHVDTVLVTVTNTPNPPVLDSLSFSLAATDSAKVAFPGSKVVPVTAWDTSGAIVSGLPIHYAVSDPTIATVRPLGTNAQVRSVRPGQVMVIATTTAYGVTKADTLLFTVGLSLNGKITITQRMGANGEVRNVFVPDRITIGTGGDISWYNETGIPTDVIFDDPADVVQSEFWCKPFYTDKDPALCASGNIEAFGVPLTIDGVADPTAFYHNRRVRHFPVSGTYTFHSTTSGATGTIIVVDEGAP